jgi:cytochrome oxidase assembly protein ShyY1
MPAVFPIPGVPPRVLQVELGNHRLRASAWMTLLACAGCIAFGLLGRWQWHRAAEKRALEAAFAAGSLQPPTELGARSTADLPRYAAVRVHGQYDWRHQFLLDNMGHAGVTGYQVLTPLLLDDGRVLLVNRGWLPLPEGRRDRLPEIAPLPYIGPPQGAPGEGGGGRIDLLPVAAISMGHAAPDAGPVWPKRTSFPTTAELAAALGRPIEPRELLLAAGEPQGYLRDWQPAGEGFGPTRHLAYALQWWAFAALTLFLYLFLNIERRQA